MDKSEQANVELKKIIYKSTKANEKLQEKLVKMIDDEEAVCKLIEEQSTTTTEE